MKVLVLGSHGFLGSYLGFALPRRGHHVVGLSRQPAPYFPHNTVTPSFEDISGVIAEHSVDVVINAVAVASHEACENNPEEAHHVNAVLPGQWAKQAASAGAALVHISTDAVFGGENEEPYDEDDEATPISVYGRTKLDGERAVALAHPEALIARANFFGWSASGTTGVLDFFWKSMTEKREITGFSDYRVSSLYMGHLATALMDAVALKASGVHHIVAARALSKFDFGMAVAKEFGLDSSQMKAGLVGSKAGLAQRGVNLELSTKRIEAVLGRPMESIEEGVALAQRERSALMDYFGESEGVETSHEN